MVGSRRSIVLGAVVVAVVAAACGGAEPDRVSLAEAFELTPETYRARLIVAEELVAECMRAEGFDYVPSVPPPMEAPDRLTPPTPAEARRDGYGISTRPFETFVAPDDAGRPLEEDEEEAPARAAYDEALYGDPNTLADDEYRPIGSTGLGGCYEAGYRAAFADLAAAIERAEPLIDDLQARFESDPRIVALEGEWRRCMAAAGFPFSSQEEALRMLNDRFSGIVDVRDADGDPETPEVTYVYDPAALEALRADERAIAEADATCSESLRETATAVWREYERRFEDEHAEVLDEVRRAIRDGPSIWSPTANPSTRSGAAP